MTHEATHDAPITHEATHDAPMTYEAIPMTHEPPP